MKGYTIQHSIELLEKQAGSGSGGASTAAQVSFDNTGTGLVATNVQSAIGEVNTKADDISGRFNYSATEKVIGKWVDNRDIYQLSYTIESDISISHDNFTNMTELTTPEHIDLIVDSVLVRSTNKGPISHDCAIITSGDNVYVGVRNSTAYDITFGAGSVLTIRYVKTAPASHTRSKKVKKEEN